MKKYDIENEFTDYTYERDSIKNFSDPNEFIVIKNNRKKLNMAVLRVHQMYYFFEKCAEYDVDENKKKDKKEEELYDIEKIKLRFNVAGMIFEPGQFLYILSMIKKQFTINEQTFFITQNYLYHKIIYDIYNINDSNDEEEDGDKNNDVCCKFFHSIKKA